MTSNKSLAWHSAARLCGQVLITQLLLMSVVVVLTLWLQWAGLLSLPVLIMLALAFFSNFVAIIYAGKQLAMGYNQAHCGLWDTCMIGRLLVWQLLVALLALLILGLLWFFV